MTTDTRHTSIDDAARSVRDALTFHLRQHELYLEHGTDDDDVIASGQHAAAYGKCVRALRVLVGDIATRECVENARRAVSREVHGA